MSAQCQSLRVAGDHVRPAAELGAGWWFWRLRGTQGAATGASTSAVWQLRVGARSATGDRDRSWGVWPDVDGDGAGDVLVGAQGAHSSAGEATVWRATATTLVEQPSLRVRGSVAGDRFGAAVATLGDINGDGYGDYAIGAPEANAGAGAVRVRFGGPSMLADATLSGVDHALAGAQFGASIAGLGDVDGDGYGDFAVGAPHANPVGCLGCGFVRVFFGAASGVSARTPARMQGRAIADLFGSAVSGVGDFNGDGFADMAVGAPGSTPSGRAECGEVHLFAGSSAGFSTVADRVIECLVAGDIFGWSVSGAGDVNGDGLADFVVGAHNTQGGMPATIGGIAAVFEGALTASAVRLGVVLNGDVFDRQGWSVSSAGSRASSAAGPRSTTRRTRRTESSSPASASRAGRPGSFIEDAALANNLDPELPADGVVTGHRHRWTAAPWRSWPTTPRSRPARGVAHGGEDPAHPGDRREAAVPAALPGRLGRGAHHRPDRDVPRAPRRGADLLQPGADVGQIPRCACSSARAPRAARTSPPSATWW
jgi:hypothetical protein